MVFGDLQLIKGAFARPAVELIIECDDHCLVVREHGAPNIRVAFASLISVQCRGDSVVVYAKPDHTDNPLLLKSSGSGKAARQVAGRIDKTLREWQLEHEIPFLLEAAKVTKGGKLLPKVKKLPGMSLEDILNGRGNSMALAEENALGDAAAAEAIDSLAGCAPPTASRVREHTASHVTATALAAEQHQHSVVQFGDHSAAVSKGDATKLTEACADLIAADPDIASSFSTFSKAARKLPLSELLDRCR